MDLRPLATLFASEVVAVAHAADQDLEVLDTAVGAVPARLFDTQVAAGFLGFSSPALVRLAEAVLHVGLPKADRLTDWNRRPLTDSQRQYAAADVTSLLELRAELSRRLDAVGRLAWAEQECEELRRRPRRTPDPEIAWWRLKEGRSLRGRSRLVAQEVAAWRERRAAARDIPPRFVLPDLAVVALASKPPHSVADLGEVRGLDARQLKGGTGEQLIEIVRAATKLPDTALRLPPVEDFDRQLRPAVALLAAWVAQLAHDLRIDAALLATRSDLQALLSDDPDARLATGWRAELVGDRVRQVVRGQAALAFVGGGRLVLEERSNRPFTFDLPVPEPPEGPEAPAGDD